MAGVFEKFRCYILKNCKLKSLVWRGKITILLLLFFIYLFLLHCIQLYVLTLVLNFNFWGFLIFAKIRLIFFMVKRKTLVSRIKKVVFFVFNEQYNIIWSSCLYKYIYIHLSIGYLNSLWQFKNSFVTTMEAFGNYCFCA